jgi:sec-independent protein translocase protein TatC
MPPLDGADVGKEMPFLDHLEELRWRILYALLALVVGVVGAFVLLTRYKVLTILQGPILPFLNGGTLVYTHPADPFRITMTLALIIGTILALPVILFQLWSFVAPALYSHEKRIVIPVLMMGSLLFLAGLTLSWFVILPLTLGFLYNIQAEGLTAMITFREYFGFAISMSVALGLVFELPIVILALTALGVVTPQFLNRYGAMRSCSAWSARRSSRRGRIRSRSSRSRCRCTGCSR